MKSIVYTVTAYRWGSREMHSYIVGVRSKKHAALKLAEQEEAHRGGTKYICEVLEWTVDSERMSDSKIIKRLPLINTLESMK